MLCHGTQAKFLENYQEFFHIYHGPADHFRYFHMRIRSRPALQTQHGVLHILCALFGNFEILINLLPGLCVHRLYHLTKMRTGSLKPVKMLLKNFRIRTSSKRKPKPSCPKPWAPQHNTDVFCHTDGLSSFNLLTLAACGDDSSTSILSERQQ